MGGLSDGGPRIVLETDRLVLRPWRVSDAALQRELWAERDPRVPAHRRIGADGRPTIAELERRIRTSPAPRAIGLLAAERKGTDAVIGYCGLIETADVPAGEPELAFELLRRFWGQGLATEASWAVVGWARASGHRRLWATVREWNAASLRVLAKLEFTRTDRVEPGAIHGDSLFLTKPL